MAKKDKIKAQGMSDEEIGVAMTQYRERLVALRTQAVTEKVENNRQFGEIRRNIARLKTERRAQELRKTPKKVKTAAVK
jgi:ribosomal protein L29